MTPGVSLLIVNFNAGEALVRCLEAVAAQTLLPTRLLLIENASTDGSLEKARALIASKPTLAAIAEIFPNPKNRGFAAANNRAVAKCDTEFVALLNPDAIPRPDWLENLLATAARHPQAASFGSLQMRDALSAAVVAGLRRRPENCFGIDPAQLLALPAYAAEILGTANLPDADGRALVFVARARHSPGALAAFLGSLSQATGTDLCWLPWGDRLSFPFLEDPPSGMSLLPIENDVPFGRLAPLLRSVAAANFVVTDTYHLAVVAWALGVPAIVLAGDYHEGERAGKQVDLRVRHDKRKVLLAQDGLLDFFVEPALIADPTGRAAVVERLAATMADPECGPGARRRLAEKAASNEAALSEAIAQSQTS